MIIELTIINSLLLPLKALSNKSTSTAPAKILNPIGSPRIPTPIGSCPYTLNACVGQKRRTEKKLAPDMKVMTRVRARIRGLCFKRAGNMGNLANFASQIANATSRKKPRNRGTRTWAVFQGY